MAYTVPGQFPNAALPVATTARVTDFAEVVATAARNGAATSPRCAGSHALPFSACVDETQLRMVSTTPLHPTRCRACGAHRCQLDTVPAAVTATTSSPLLARASFVGFGSLTSSTNNATTPGGILRGADRGPSRSPRPSMRHTARGSSLALPGTARGTTMAPPASSAAPVSQTAAARDVSVAVTAQHVLDGPVRAVVLGYEDGTVRLVRFPHQANHDDGLHKAGTQAKETGDEMRQWRFAELMAGTSEETPATVSASARDAELHTGSPHGQEVWSPVIAVHAVPAAVAPAHSMMAAGESDAAALVAVAYQDCVVVMTEPYADPIAPSAAQRRRLPVQKVRVVVSATTLRRALHEASSGRVPLACPAEPPTSRSGTGEGAPHSRSPAAPVPTCLDHTDPLLIASVRVSPGGSHLAVHLASPVPCVLVFALPPVGQVGTRARTVSSDDHDSPPPPSSAAVPSEKDSAPFVVVRPPTALVGGCRAPRDATMRAGDAAASTVPASVYAESFFLCTAAGGDNGAPSPASSTATADAEVLVVAWVNTRCLARVWLRRTHPQTSNAIQRARTTASDAARHERVFDDGDSMRGGGAEGQRPSSSTLSRGRVSSARRDRAREPTPGTSSSPSQGRRSTDRRGSSSSAHSPSPPHSARPHRATMGGRSSVAGLHAGPSTSSAKTGISALYPGGTALGDFSRVQPLLTTQPISCACAVSGDARLALVGLQGGAVQLIDVVSMSRALFSVVAPSCVAQEVPHRWAPHAVTGPCASSMNNTTHSPFLHSVDAAGLTMNAGHSLHSDLDLSARACLAQAAVTAPLESTTTFVNDTTVVRAGKPVPPGTTAITLLQAYTGDSGELIVVAGTATRGDEAAEALVGLNHHARETQTALRRHCAAVITFARGQLSRPMTRCYLTHLPGPVCTVLPLHPLPAVLVGIRVAADGASDPSTPLAHRGGLAPLHTVTASGGGGAGALVAHGHSPPPPTVTTLWWDTAFDTIIGTVPPLHVRLCQCRTVLGPLPGLAGGSHENTATELASASVLGRSATAALTRFASTAGSTISRRQPARAPRQAETALTAVSASIALSVRNPQPPAFGWRASQHALVASAGSTEDALHHGPVLLWLQEADVAAEKASLGLATARDGDDRGEVDAVMTTPVCWPVEALLALAYPTLTTQLPGLSLDDAARVLSAVAPQHRHRAAAYRRLRQSTEEAHEGRPGTAPGALRLDKLAANLGAEGGVYPSITFGRSPLLGVSRTERVGVSATSGDTTRHAFARPHAPAHSRPASRACSPPSRPTSSRTTRSGPTAQPFLLPTLLHTTAVVSATPPVSGAPMYRGPLTHFPQAWLTALRRTAAERDAHLVAVVAQFSASKAS